MVEGACPPNTTAAHSQEGGQAISGVELHPSHVSGGTRGINIPGAHEEDRSELQRSDALGVGNREGSNNADQSFDGDAAAQKAVRGRNEGIEDALGKCGPSSGSCDGASGDRARASKPRRRAASRECKLLLVGSVWQDPSPKGRGQKRNAAVAGEVDSDQTGDFRRRSGVGQRGMPTIARVVAIASQGRQSCRSGTGTAKGSGGQTRQSGQRASQEAQHNEPEQYEGSVRGRVHPGREKGERQRQGSLPSEVVGIRPDMGAVEAEWDGRRSSGVLGTPLQHEEHGSAAAMEGAQAINSSEPAESTAARPPGLKQCVRGGRCQRHGCLALRQTLAEVREELVKCTNDRNNLLATWEEQLNGARRILASDFQQVEEERDEAWRRERDAKQRRAYDIKIAQRLHEEKAELLNKVAMLQAENAVLKADAARRLVEDSCRRKQEVREVNACELKLREANRVLKRAEKVRAEAMLMHEDAAQKAAQAQQDAENARQQADGALQEAIDARQLADAANRAVEESARQAIAEAEESAEDARKEAKLAREEAIAAHAEVNEIRIESDLAKRGQLLANRQAEKAEQKARDSQAKLAKIIACHPTIDRSVDEWAALSRSAAYKAGQRERAYLRAFLKSHSWRPEDIASALSAEGLLEPLFDTRDGFQIYFDKVKVVVQKLEQDDFGIAFGLFLRYEMRMTTDKILRLTQAACKQYHRSLDFYEAKVLLYHPFRKDLVVKVCAHSL